ncbi:MAG: lectin-like protein, partial [Oscillospiraceae bacterium]|nr:lectin-like protein [Oscillospiraceae bacterium]
MKTSVLYGDHTYALYDTNLSWTSAKAACESMGGHLAVITSSAEQNAINTLISKSTDSTKKGYWIGATDSEKEGTWKWVTGESFGSYKYWASGEPNNENNAEHYMEISMTNKQWNDDANGASNRGFICEFEDSEVPCAQTVYKGHIYSVYNDSLSWTGAKAFCENIGGHLVTITDQEEQEVVNNLITGQMKGLYWIGASDSETEGTWKWVTDEPFDYSNWGTNEPSGTSSDTQDYVQVYSTDYSSIKPLGCWNDDYNSGSTNNDYYRPANIGFICEVETESISPVARAYLGNNLYELYDCCLTWRDADLYSEMNGGHLCVITDEAENEFIVNLISKGSAASGYRLGVTDEEQEGVWKTVTGESFSYTYWADGEPSSNANKDEDYLEYFKSKSAWNDTKNASPGRGFVVEYENHHETLTYAEKDGSVIASYSVQGNEAVSRPDELEKRGYTTNWYADSNFDVPWDFNNIITEETVIFAERIPHKFTVYFDYNGATGKIAKKTVTFDSKYGVFPTPAREGYTFDGWYTSDSKKIGYSDIVDLDADITVSAKWIPNEYSVSFDLNGGVSESGSESTNPITVTFGSAYGSLPKPSKEGFRFAEWKLSDGTSIYSSSTVNTASDHTLFACWDTRAVTNCELYSLPYKTEYVLGDTLDTEGLKIEITYDTGESEVVDCGFDCTPDTFESQGLQTVSVIYNGFTMTFDVNVTKGMPCEISISSLPDKTSYFVGETLDMAGLSLLATYLDGSQDTITSGFECSVSTLKREGTQRVTVNYGECSAVFNVTVLCGSIVGISINTLPEKLQYFVGEKLDTSGLSLKVEYQGSVYKTISDGFTAFCDLTSAGAKDVTVNYSENGVTVSAKYSIDVNERDFSCVSSPELSVVSGDILSIPFSINNNKGFMGFGIIIEYDETAFSPISVASGDILSNGTLNNNIEVSDSRLIIMYSDSENVTSDGILFTVDFAVNDTADGVYNFNLSYISNDTFNENWEEVKFIFNSGNVSVINSSAMEDSVRFHSEPLNAKSASSVTVPLIAENAVGMNSFELNLSFDQSVFTFAEVEAGEILNGSKLQAIIDASNNLYFKWEGSALEQDG